MFSPLGRVVSTEGSTRHSKLLTLKYQFQNVNLPSGFIASEFQGYSIDDLYVSTLHLHQLFSSRQEPTFVMASQLTLFGDSTMNTKSTRRSYTREPKRRCSFGCGQFLPFIIKRILGIKRIFPCSFGNKHMRLLTCVYGMQVYSYQLKEGKHSPSSNVLTLSGDVYGPSPIVTAATEHTYS